MNFINIMLYVSFGVFAFLFFSLLIGISVKEKVDENKESENL